VLRSASQAIESLFEVCVAFGAFWFTFGITAPAAWRLNSRPLCGLEEGEGSWWRRLGL
jgi:hypothetical protein